MSLHEARIVRRGTGAGQVAAPKVVRGLLLRWERFVAGTSGAEPLFVASLRPGSLRIVFASSAATRDRVESAFAKLVSSGEDPNRLTKVAGEALAGYFDLLRFLDEAKCSLELREPYADGAPKVELSRALAGRQLKVLNRPSEASADFNVTGRVVAASLPKGTIEIEHGDIQEEMHVPHGSRSHLKGMKIGALYKFDATRTEKRENPSASPRIELQIREAIQASVIDSLLEDDVPRRQVARQRVVPRAWWKKLATTDAMHNASSHSRPYVPLTGARHAIDTKTWFRKEMFDTLEWTPALKKSLGDVAEIDLFVTVMGVPMGIETMALSHAPARATWHNAPATHLHWSPLLRRILAEEDYTGHWLVLRRERDGRFSLTIQDVEPTG